MYTAEMARFYAKRCLSTDYQTAYDVIAKQLKSEKYESVVDIGCGSGELMRRVYRMARPRLLMGTDISEEMLCIAQRNLQSYGIECAAGDPAQVEEKEGVFLVNDDVRSSGLPYSAFDVAIISFPDVGSDVEMSEIGDRLILDYVRRFGPIKRSKHYDYVATLRAYHHMSRCIKRGGILLDVNYQVRKEKGSAYNEEMLENVRGTADFFGMDAERVVFFESPGVWEDLDMFIKGDSILRLKQAGVKRGYTVTRMRKR
jgi:SAM-dependent methyltransferase